MKETGSSQVLTIIFRLLAVLAFALILTLILGSVWAFVFKQPEDGGGTAGGTVGAPDAGPDVFTGIGRLRLLSSDSMMVILSVSFPYNTNDRPFCEELALRTGDFRAITGDYFKRYTAAEIRAADEEKIKEVILDQYNSVLRLGKISILYFNDFMVME